jgi:hypothetical protein
MSYCPVTGLTKCRCSNDKKLIPAEKVDLKAALRKLFSDHGIFTSFVIHSIVDGTEDVNDMVKRILQNQVDIGNQLKPIIGEEKAKRLTYLLLQHIELASDVMKAAKSESKNVLVINKMKLFDNSRKVAEFLTSLNPEKLPLQATKEMFDMHNQFVIDMTVARLSKEFAKEIRLFDAYFNELLEMSDSIYNAL